MKKEKISVIVPVYNAEKYVNECIQSILMQTYDNLELIVVDDGSTDRSAEICDKAVKANSRIKVIHQENQGVTKARYNGFMASCGEYIYFADADDTLEKDALEYMLSLFRDDIDIVVSDYKQNVMLNWIEYSKLLLKHDLLAVFSKLYRRRLLDDFVFDTARYFSNGEDFLMQLRILKNIKGCVFCSSVSKYHYRNVSDSVSHTFIPTMEYEIKMLQEVKDIICILPRNKELSHAYLKFRIAWLGGMIGLRYPISYKEQWVIDIVNESKTHKLGLKEKISIWAVKYILFRYILVTEKFLRHLYRKYLK